MKVNCPPNISDHELSLIEFETCNLSSSSLVEPNGANLLTSCYSQNTLIDISAQRNFNFGMNFHSSDLVENNAGPPVSSIGSIVGTNSITALSISIKYEHLRFL